MKRPLVLLAIVLAAAVARGLSLMSPSGAIPGLALVVIALVLLVVVRSGARGDLDPETPEARRRVLTERLAALERDPRTTASPGWTEARERIVLELRAGELKELLEELATLEAGASTVDLAAGRQRAQALASVMARAELLRASLRTQRLSHPQAEPLESAVSHLIARAGRLNRSLADRCASLSVRAEPRNLVATSDLEEVLALHAARLRDEVALRELEAAEAESP